MKPTHSCMTFTLAALLPTVLVAQDAPPPSATQSASTQVRAESQTSVQVTIPPTFSAESRSALQAMYDDTRARGLSTSAIANLVAEGQAKGASEATIVKAAGMRRTQLVTTFDAMVRGGRPSPSNDEVDRGANLMARGASALQIETLTRRAPADRSLTVAFEVLTDLTTRGVPVTNALAQVQTKLEQRASDASLRELGANVGLGLGAQGRMNGASAAGAANANGAATGTTRGVGATVGGTVTGAVGGVIRKP